MFHQSTCQSIFRPFLRYRHETPINTTGGVQVEGDTKKDIVAWNLNKLTGQVSFCIANQPFEGCKKNQDTLPLLRTGPDVEGHDDPALRMGAGRGHRRRHLLSWPLTFIITLKIVVIISSKRVDCNSRTVTVDCYS